MNLEKFIYNTFIRLTSKTCPHGHEHDFIKEVVGDLFPKDINKDEHGNYFYKIGKSKTVFASHIDTVSKLYIPVKQIVDNNYIRTEGNTTLGADDKAGMTIMLWMIKNNIPGMYYFFIGEEVGCIGSGLAAKFKNIGNEYNRIISFDRRGTTSIITHQSYMRCCSDIFAKKLCNELNLNGMMYSPDNSGVYTDSAEFISIIPECTNISVGYYKEHTNGEYQDIHHLVLLADACTKVKWESLPTVRDPKKESYLFDNSYYNWDSSNFKENNYKKRKRKRRNNYINKDLYSSVNKPNIYLDRNGKLESLYDNKIDNSLANDNERYTWIIEKYINYNFTHKELQIVKYCYLNMNSENDNFFYQYLLENIKSCRDQ